MGLLNAAETKSVEDAIATAESKTAGEIVVVILPSSDSYAAYRALVAGTCACGLAITALGWIPPLAFGWAIAAQVPLALLLDQLFCAVGMVRAIVPAAVQKAAVTRRARATFLERGLTETRDRSGVLILISRFERRVELLADRGIHEAVGTPKWQTQVAAITQGIRAGEAGKALVRAIEEIGAELAAAFPPRQDDTNELSNAVVEER